MEVTPSPSQVRRVGRWMTRPWVAWLLCLVAGLLVYAPALSGDLIWDDYYLVRENPFFRSPVFGAEVFRHYLFFDSFSTYYRPVQNWSYMVDYWLWRGDPVGFHLTNILLHSLSGILLFEVLRRLLLGLAPRSEEMKGDAPFHVAMLVALIWIVHPIHNAAVAYISGRADSLASFFALLAWLVASRACESKSVFGRLGMGGAAALIMLLALCSKEIALLWLAIFAVHLIAFERGLTWRARGIAFAGALSVLGVYAVLHALPSARAPMENGPPLPLDGRFLLMLRALGDYAGLILYPGRLYMERALSDPAIYGSVAAWRENPHYEYLTIVGTLAALGGFYLCRQRWPGRRLRCFGALWFIAAFLPISNLFPLNAEVAEHWIYLASIGALLLLAGSALALPRRGQIAAGAFAFVAIMALGVRTSVRAGDWVNAETFCLRTIADGGGTPRILSTLASLYGERGDFSKQEAILRKMIARFPDFAPARINLGICLSKQGRATDAETLLRVDKAVADEVSHRYPRTWPAALNLARLRHEAQHDDEALAVLAEARARFPETWELVKYESELRKARQGVAAAMPAVADYAAAHWWHLDSWVTLGRLRYSAGEPDAAIAALRAASRLDIYNAGPLTDIARIELERGRPEAALAEQLEAMRRERGQPSHYLMLGSIFEKLGRRAEADEAVRKAQTLAAEARRSS
jgi:protein O-mannosyl-transferase